jgi:hypothetical protein
MPGEEECVAASDIVEKQDGNSVVMAVEEGGKKHLYHFVAEGKQKTGVPARVARCFHC